MEKIFINGTGRQKILYMFKMFLFMILLNCTGLARSAAKEYHFQGGISKQVLENYLSRSTTYCELLNPPRLEELGSSLDESIRYLSRTGAKFIGRSIYMWGRESRLPELLERGRQAAAKVHKADPEIVLQACAFEIVTDEVNTLPIPEWVFQEFGLSVEQRYFNLDAMRYPPNRYRDNWGRDSSIIPDITRPETQMWFFYLIASYVDIGVEAIHLGQVEIMNECDPENDCWYDVAGRIRKYARTHARRGFVICDAHVPSGGIVKDGKLLLDFHSFPLRVEELLSGGEQGYIAVGHYDSIYQKSKGGITPSGWKCQSLPYLVEFDNFGRSGHEGQVYGLHWIWGYDEIGWFARQPKEYREMWLHYAWHWLKCNDPAGHLQMPGSRVLHSPVDGNGWYWANNPSEALPTGFGDEDIIKGIWTVDE
ncbi:MAG: hypothetical protein JXA82_16640 [Sedimentisphaerales bacterium]|nr:hypothetical protein [Sedimentisphaerales bacterium]